VVPADALAGADDAETGRLVKGGAGGVFGNDPRLDGPDPGGLCGGDQGIQELAPDALAPCLRVYVDGVLSMTPA
jgi:hypothetical protein